MANKSKITDRASIEHKSVCVKAGIIPGTGYAQKFCEYLLGTGASDWYTEENGEVKKWKGKEIKAHKKAWITERAGAKSDSEAEDALMKSQQAEETTKKINEAEKSASTTKEKITVKENKIDNYKQQIKKLNNEKNDVIKSSKRAGRATDSELISKLDKQINDYAAQITKEEEELESLKKQHDAEKKQIAEEQKAAKEYAKGNQWWYKKLKSFKQDQYDKDAEKGNPRLKVSEEYQTDDLIDLAVYANKKHNGKEHKMWTYYDVPEKKGELDTALESIWNSFNEATSIRNNMDAAVLEDIGALTPDSSVAFLKGAVSNTFAAAKQGVELIQNPDIIKQRGIMLANATTSAVEKLTSRVTGAVTDSIAQIMDVTPIVQIPADAAQEMVNHILRPDEVMKLISDALNDDKVMDDADKEIKDRINGIKNKFNEKVQEINFLIGDKLNAFNKNVDMVRNAINQGPDWYIDNINKLERQAEKEAIKAISDVTANVLDTKYQFRDNAVDVISYNLVIPVNEALIKVQLEVIRLLVQAIKRAEAIAKALAQKAIMKLLGLLGA